MRCFVAIDLPERIKDFIGSLIKPSFSLKGINIVQPKNYHITLKFLGEISERLIPELKVLLKAVAGEFKSFELVITTPGVFPNQRAPRVIWIGTDNNPELVELAKRIDEKLEIIGFEREERDFKSHITLARIKNVSNGKYFYEELMRNYKFAIENITPDSLKFEVSNITLMRSTLTSAGSIYDSIESFSLIKK